MSSNTILICRLSQLGLIEAPQSLSLGQFLSDYIHKRSDLKELTKRKLQTTNKCLVAHFGKTLPLGAITQGMADDFRLQLIGKGLFDNTVRKHSQICKQFFTDAVRHRLIDENPFADQHATGRPNPKRQYFVSREDASHVMNYCPDIEWKRIFALCRYGGLRCPSELVLLQWTDSDFNPHPRFRVTPKGFIFTRFCPVARHFSRVMGRSGRFVLRSGPLACPGTRSAGATAWWDESHATTCA